MRLVLLILFGLVHSIKITSSGPKIIFTTNVHISQGQGGKLEVLAFEEPADVIARFVRDKGLAEVTRQDLIRKVCDSIPCRRNFGDVLIMNTPISWFSEIDNEYCSVVLRMGESDLENMTEYIQHHCHILENAYPSCICSESITKHLSQQVEQNAAAFIWSEYSSPHTRLGVSKNATEREIRKAYRGLSKRLHPDTMVKEGIEVDPARREEKFMLLTDAYERLMNEISNKPKPTASDMSTFADNDEGFTVSVAGFTIHMHTGFRAVRDASGNIIFESV